MKKQYILKHIDNDVAEFSINQLSNRIVYFKIIDNKYCPINSNENELAQAISFNSWLSDRCIPNSREGIERLKNKYNISDIKQVMLYMYGLSLSDHYWIDRHPFINKWKNINLYENRYNELIGSLLFDKKLKLVNNFDNFGNNNPDITTGGSLKKYWKYNEIENLSYLIKGGSKKDYQEPFNEYYAHLLLNKLEYLHTPYFLEENNNEYVSSCPCISDINTEMVSGVDLIRKYGIEKSYKGFLDLGIKNGCVDFRDEVNKMIVIDYLIDNIDRHWHNFGILRNSRDGKWKGLIPIFDNGYSLWNKDFVDNNIISESMSFADSNEECLKLINISKYVNKLPNMLDIFDEAFDRYKNIERKKELRKGIEEKIKIVENIIEKDIINKNNREDD